MARRKNPLKQMSLGGHLTEFRNRFFWAALSIILGSVAGWFLFDPIFNGLQDPIIRVAHQDHINATINFSTIGGAFDLRLQVSAAAGVVISSPFWLYQLWAYVVPALRRRERQYTLAFLLTAIPLFVGGCLMAWYALPNFVGGLLSVTPRGAANLINANEYILFAVRILLVFGISFVSPVVIVLLNFMGVLTAKGILKGWRLAVVVAAFIGALSTPVSDPTSMFLLMAPLLVLYFVAVGIAAIRDRVVGRRRRKELEAMGIIDAESA
jgi:sec-independent protein translocase protein TatC